MMGSELENGLLAACKKIKPDCQSQLRASGRWVDY